MCRGGGLQRKEFQPSDQDLSFVTRHKNIPPQAVLCDESAGLCTVFCHLSLRWRCESSGVICRAGKGLALFLHCCRLRC